MAASFVPPKRDIVALIEDVEAAGVRFVYFSPRNMRRSKVSTRTSTPSQTPNMLYLHAYRALQWYRRSVGTI